MCQATFEFGPDGNDSLAIVGSADVDILALTTKGLVWVDTDFAIVGGTGERCLQIERSDAHAWRTLQRLQPQWLVQGELCCCTIAHTCIAAHLKQPCALRAALSWRQLSFHCIVLLCGCMQAASMAPLAGTPQRAPVISAMRQLPLPMSQLSLCCLAVWLHAGRFNGAFGRHASKGIDLFKYETVVTAYVPRVREF